MLKDNAIIYKAEKDGEEYLGATAEISKLVNVDTISLPSLVKRGFKIHGYKVTVLGHYKKLYELYDTENNDVFVGRGSIEEVSKLLYLAQSTVYSAAKVGRLALDRYKVVQCGHKVVDNKGYIIDCDY